MALISRVSIKQKTVHRLNCDLRLRKSLQHILYRPSEREMFPRSCSWRSLCRVRMIPRLGPSRLRYHTELMERMYYFHDKMTYLCIRSSGVPLYYALGDLVGVCPGRITKDWSKKHPASVSGLYYYTYRK